MEQSFRPFFSGSKVLPKMIKKWEIKMSQNYCDTPKICILIDSIILKISKIFCWLNFFILLTILLQIGLRYLLGKGYVFLDELEWHFYAIAFLFGLSYAEVNDKHIRLDVLSHRFSMRTREIIEIMGNIFLLFPYIVILFIHGLDFAHEAWIIGETSGSPMGLAYRWFIKSFIPIGMFFLGISVISRTLKSIAFLAKKSNKCTEDMERRA